MLNKKKIVRNNKDLVFLSIYFWNVQAKVGKNFRMEMKQNFGLFQMIFSWLTSKIVNVRNYTKNFANDTCHSFIHSLRIPSKKYVIYFRLPYHDSQKMCVSISFWWKWQSLEQEVRKKLGGKTRFFSQESQSLEFCWKEENFLVFLKTLNR